MRGLFKIKYSSDMNQTVQKVPIKSLSIVILLIIVIFTYSCLQPVYIKSHHSSLNQIGSRNLKKSEIKKGWFAFDSEDLKQYFFDFSFLLDAPAGKHGFIKTTKDGKLIFEDGTPIRFFGVNIVAENCFPDRERAERIAEMLSKMGINLVRLHHLDAPWSSISLIDYSRNDSRHFNYRAWRKLDYLIFQLKKRGIYIYLDFLVHREFKKGDGVKALPPELGAKQVGWFDPILIRLQKEYIKAVLTHYNRYTKLRYIDDPAIVCSELLNENTIFTRFEGYKLPEYYDNELEDKWKSFVTDTNVRRAKFSILWSGEPHLEDERVSETEKYTSIRFYYEIAKKYILNMKQFLKKLGIKYLLTGSNFGTFINADIKLNSLLDYSDIHCYWDHPKVWLINNEWNRIIYAPIDNTPAVKSYTNFFSDLIKVNIKNKPFFVSEFNPCYPNQYRITGLPIVTLYGMLQGFDGILYFDAGELGKDDCEVGKKVFHSFSLNQRPDIMNIIGIMALMFIRGDIEESKSDINIKIGDDYLYGNNSSNPFLNSHRYLAFLGRTTVEFMDNRSYTRLPDLSNVSRYFKKEKNIIESDTGELIFNYGEGVIFVNSSRAQGCLGFTGNKKIELRDVEIKIKNEHSVVLLNSIDNLPLNKSKKIILTAIGRVENYNQKFDTRLHKLVDEGSLPIIFEAIEATIKLKNFKGYNVKIKPLYWNRYKKGMNINYTTEGNDIEFSIGSRYKTTHYIIER